MKTQRDLIIDLTLERDLLKSELQTVKTAVNENIRNSAAGGQSSTGSSEINDKLTANGVLTRNRRKALQDVNAIHPSGTTEEHTTVI